MISPLFCFFYNIILIELMFILFFFLFQSVLYLDLMYISFFSFLLINVYLILRVNVYHDSYVSRKP